jgi:RND family efflux transporter MFP subunit
MATTLRSKTARAARRSSQLPAPDMLAAPVEVRPPSERDDIRSILDHELQRLPERFRTPMVLCYLEGRTVDEAAMELGCPRGTVASRLARGRRRLRVQLTNRGWSVPTVAIAAALAGAHEANAASHALISSAARFAAFGGATATLPESAVPARVLSVTREVLRAMSIKKQTTVAAVLIAFCGVLLLGSGLGLNLLGGAAAKSDPPPTAADAPKQPPNAGEKEKEKRTKAADEPAVAKVEVSHPVPREMAPFEDYTGRLEAADSAQVLASASGRLDRILCQAGTAVNKGQVLFEIDPRAANGNLLKAQANLQAAEARLKQSNSELKRLSRLADTGIMSKEELNKAATAVDVDEALVRVAQVDVERAKLELDATKVAAPIDGIIGRIQVSAGTPITAEKTVLTTVNVLNPMQVLFDMDELNFLRYRKLAREEKVKEEGALIMIGLADEQGFPHQGKVASIDDRIDPASGTIRVRGLLPNSDRQFLPGMFARVRVTFGPPRQVLQIPREAGFGSGARTVGVVKNNIVEERIVLGRFDGDVYLIERGLSPDDWVVNNGSVADTLSHKGHRVEPQQVESPLRSKSDKD